MTDARDSSLGEKPVSENVIRISPDGPLYFRGKIQIDAEDGRAIFSDTHAAICRCGASQNKPLCDGSHSKTGFSDVGMAAPAADGEADTSASKNGDAMKISPRLNGPLHVQGKLRIENSAGEIIFRGDDAWICRCGGSKNKPFCDGTHKAIGFRSGEKDGFPPSRAKA
ncbi:MAG TPA: CDGSH iron-sulfur domain-containing protein [Candidatus Acidoferrales bacterium]|nr:CDGSH iron-sulfur domain-containing protein [Candidatus Acidoferrales bacterium]